MPKLVAVALFVLTALLVFSRAPADASPETAIRDALAQWTRDFNTRNTAKICDLFDSGLRYDYRGFPERGFDDICPLLRRSLGDGSKTYSYSPQIKEVLVFG